MNIKIVAYGIAKDILNGSKKELVLPNDADISALKQLLLEQYPAFSKLQSLRFAVNEDYQGNDYQLNENDEVVIIPPVSGG